MPTSFTPQPILSADSYNEVEYKGLQKFDQTFLRKGTTLSNYVEIDFVIWNHVSYNNDVITIIIMTSWIFIYHLLFVLRHIGHKLHW